MTEGTVAWCAGLFEGEGSISFVGKQGVTLKVSMTDEDVIRRLHVFTGVGQVGGPYQGTNKPKWAWYVGEKTAVTFLLHLWRPWLGQRRGAKADEALARLALPRTRALKPIEHGTRNGYQAETRRGLPTCDTCRHANNEHNIARRI